MGDLRRFVDGGGRSGCRAICTDGQWFPRQTIRGSTRNRLYQCSNIFSRFAMSIPENFRTGTVVMSRLEYV